MPDFPPALAHGPITEVFPDVFVVRGTFPFAPLMTVARNMIILREGTDLTLVNAIRLTPEGERSLAELGEVRHLVKLGHFHNRDYAYTRDRYRPTYWAPSPPDAACEKLVDGAPGPVARAGVFVFEHTGAREAAFVVEQAAGGLLVTCDSVQHWPDTAGCSWLGGLVSRRMGFLAQRAKIGPIWMKELTGGRPATLRPDFDRLLARDFAHLLSGHGALLRDDAHRELAASAEAVLR